MTNLTINEVKALQCCIDFSCDADDMIQDAGRIMAGMPEMMEALNWNKHQVAALIGSLEEKGMGTSDGNYGNDHIFWPSESGYRAAYKNLNLTA